jgi:glycosyltransferase involved in cell wall biosynthesis
MQAVFLGLRHLNRILERCSGDILAWSLEINENDKVDMNLPIKVNVHLFYGADPTKYRAGENAGCLYGYHFAESEKYHLTYSHDTNENKLMKFFRRGLKAAVGFDFIHTWRNRREILSSDIVWTHTEFEYLAVSLLFWMTRRPKAPLLLAQSVWLLDRWPRFWAPKRIVYKFLLKRADILSVHSPVNQALMERLSGRPTELVFYGVDHRDFPLLALSDWQSHSPIRIAAIGNDRDRDWDSLIRAFDADERFSVRLATRRHVATKPKGDNIHIASVNGMVEQRALYDWADIIIVPLHDNKHVSGITVIFEGVTCGKPVVATNVGGLDRYFSADELTYVPPEDPVALRNAVLAIAADPVAALAKAKRATSRLRDSRYTIEEFAAQHVVLTDKAMSKLSR